VRILHGRSVRAKAEIFCWAWEAIDWIQRIVKMVGLRSGDVREIGRWWQGKAVVLGRWRAIAGILRVFEDYLGQAFEGET
jgi:hypothetical protein